MKQTGTVYFIGAGPGDAGLFTVKGAECLSKADVVIYDYLVNSELLGYAPEDAEMIYAGKMSSDHTLTQDKINKLIVDKALEGKIVVRLKGGDPLVFGRGGEEAFFCAHKEVPFEFVPGITAGVAVPAYAGIPLTQRGYASSVYFITGHEDPAKKDSDINWDSLADSNGTLIFYMGVKNLPLIVRTLMEKGKAPDTPVALIRWGTLPSQKTVTGRLDTIVQVSKENNITPPAVAVIGRVVGLRDYMKWFENKLLFGRRILVTRTRTQASSLCRELKLMGAEVVEFPTISIKPVSEFDDLDNTINNIKQFSWIIFTSVNGVEVFTKRLLDLGCDARTLSENKIAVIGKATGDALASFGIVPDMVPDRFTSQGTIEAFRKMKTDYSGEHILCPGSEIARDYIPVQLTNMGAVVKTVSVYKNELPEYSIGEIEVLFLNVPDLVTFTSSSTVINFVQIMKSCKMESRISEIKAAVIGPVTAKTAREAGINIKIQATEHTIPGLVSAIENYYSR